MYLHPQFRQPMYLKPHLPPPPPPLPPSQSIKRQRTPSPPRQSSSHYRSIPSRSGYTPHSAPYSMSGGAGGAGTSFHYPSQTSSGSSSRDTDERKQPLYLAGNVRYSGVESKSERARLAAVAPPAHVQPIALTTTRAGSITSGYPVHSLALSGSSLPPRFAYTQAAQLQVAAQQLAAQQAAAQAAAPPTTRYYTGSLH